MSLKCFPPKARSISWLPRQMPMMGFFPSEPFDRLHGVVQQVRVAGAGRKQDAVRLKLQDLLRRRGAGDDGDVCSPCPGSMRRILYFSPQSSATTCSGHRVRLTVRPLVRLSRVLTSLTKSIGRRSSACFLNRFQRLGRRFGRGYHAHHDAGGAQAAGDGARIDAPYPRHAVFLEVIVDRFLLKIMAWAGRTPL